MDKLVLPAGMRQDRAEDVFGGLDTVLSLSWQKVGTKVNIKKIGDICIGRYTKCCCFSIYQHPIILFMHRYCFT